MLPLKTEQQDELAKSLVKDTSKRMELLPHRKFSSTMTYHRRISQHPALLEMLAASHLRHGNLPNGCVALNPKP